MTEGEVEQVERDDWLAERFEDHRQRLRAVAVRMLGSAVEAEDAVQEAWFRLSRTDTAVLADTVGSALLVVLDTLSPSERLAFVLHDTFAVPFEEIGEILDRSADATKQLAHRARRKVQRIDTPTSGDPVRQRTVIDAFLAASRNGDFDALVALLHPDVALRADSMAVRMGSPDSTHGARSVAAMFSGRALAATPALIDGAIGVMWAVDGRPRVVWDFTLGDGVVLAIDMIADPEHLASLELVDLR